MPEDLKVDESTAFDLVTMGKSHRQKIRCQLLIAYIDKCRSAPNGGMIPDYWRSDVDKLYQWVMKDE